MPVSSLPSPYGIGTFGRGAFDFIDFLDACGQKCWQVLPLNPTSYGDSPYQSPASIAGNPYFIDPDLLRRDKLLTKEEVLQEALQSALSLPVNDKTRVEILMKYADLAQMKREEIKEEDSTIHYYLPLTCNNCSLYLASKKKKSGA